MRVNECYSVPDHVVAAVRRYDPALRLRWGRASHRMRLERQVARGMDPEGFRHDPDGFDMARQGYVLVTTFPPCEEAWARLQAYLWYGDVWRRGGAKAVDVELRAAEARDEARLAAAGSDENEGLAREMYRYLRAPRTLPEGAGAGSHFPGYDRPAGISMARGARGTRTRWIVPRSTN